MTGPHLVGGAAVTGERSESRSDGDSPPLTAETETKHSKPGEAEHPTTTGLHSPGRKLIMDKSRGLVAPVLYRVDEAAEALRLSRSAIYELIRSGRLRTVKAGRRRLVPVEALAEFVTTLDAA